MRKKTSVVLACLFFSAFALCCAENYGRGLYFDLSFGNRFLLDDGFSSVSRFSSVLTARESAFRHASRQKDDAGAVADDFQEPLVGEEQEADSEFFDGSGLLEALDGKDERGIQEGDEQKVEIPEFVYYDKDGEIRRFTYDGEQMTARKRILGYGDDGEELFQTEIVSAYGKKIKKRVFDADSRLVSSESFLIGSSAKDFSLTSSRSYSYAEDSKIPEKSSEVDYANHTGFDSQFNEKGLLLSRFDYSLPEDGSGGERTPVKRVTFEYDESDRVVVEENSVWSGGVESVRKMAYKFTDLSSDPDFEYYEDGVLRLRRNFDDEKNYYETTFMEDGYSILAYFEDGVKFYEIVYLNGVEVRRKYYDFD